MILWDYWSSDVKKAGRITRPIHIRERWNLGQSTTMAVWQGKSVGLNPYLRICRDLKLDPFKYLQADPR